VLTNIPQKFERVAPKNSKAGVWIEGLHNLSIVSSQSKKLVGSLVEEVGALTEIVEQFNELMGYEKNKQGGLFILLERARAARSMINQLIAFFGTYIC